MEAPFLPPVSAGLFWCLVFEGTHWHRGLAGSRVDPVATVVALSTQLHASLVATGRYLGILPGAMLWYCGKRLSLKVLPVELPIQPRLRSVGIVTLKNRTLSPVAQLHRLCARCRETVGENKIATPSPMSQFPLWPFTSEAKFTNMGPHSVSSGNACGRLGRKKLDILLRLGACAQRLALRSQL